ncbi:Uncharacterised protein [Providencia stuartii]|nr:Uncharacterised protein [Providencia stuartii]
MYQVNFLPWRQQRITRNKRRCFALFILQSCLVAIVVIYNSSQQQFEQNTVADHQNATRTTCRAKAATDKGD